MRCNASLADKSTLYNNIDSVSITIIDGWFAFFADIETVAQASKMMGLSKIVDAGQQMYFHSSSEEDNVILKIPFQNIASAIPEWHLLLNVLPADLDEMRRGHVGSLEMTIQTTFLPSQ